MDQCEPDFQEGGDDLADGVLTLVGPNVGDSGVVAVGVGPWLVLCDGFTRGEIGVADYESILVVHVN